jgi:hypothetical protein
MARYFPAPLQSYSSYCNNPIELERIISDTSIPVDLITKLDLTGRIPCSGDVKYIFLTKVGPGPLHQSAPEESLLNPETGLPVPPSSKHKQMRISL